MVLDKGSLTKHILIETSCPELHLENEVSISTVFILEDFNKSDFLNKNGNAIASTKKLSITYILITH